MVRTKRPVTIGTVARACTLTHFYPTVTPVRVPINADDSLYHNHLLLHATHRMKKQHSCVTETHALCLHANIPAAGSSFELENICMVAPDCDPMQRAGKEMSRLWFAPRPSILHSARFLLLHGSFSTVL